MGGHGGLNILPQKRWNVYNFDNREKVRKDEEEAAKEEQLKREQSRKRDAEFRLQKLRLARGIPDPSPSSSSSAVVQPTTTTTTTTTVVETKSNHINLFEGLKFFPTLDGEIIKGGKEDEREGSNKGFKRQKLKKEEAPKVVSAEDEKYRLGYGLAGKGVKAPWYLTRPAGGDDDQIGGSSSSGKQEERKKSGKKTLEELREERLKREKREKERELALIREKNKQGRDGGSSLKENKRGSRYHHH